MHAVSQPDRLAAARSTGGPPSGVTHRSPRRLLAVIRYPVGGISTYVRYNYPTLFEDGWRFTFVGPEGAEFEGFQSQIPTWPDTRFIGATVHRKRCRLIRPVRHELAGGGYRLVHSHGFTAGMYTSLAMLTHRLPHVITSHDVIRSDQFPGPIGYLKRLGISAVLNRAQCVIAVSHDAKINNTSYLPLLGRGRCHIETIVNGIDVSQFCPDGDSTVPSVRTLCGITEDIYLLGFLGRFMPQKGFVTLLDALEKLLADKPELRIHLVAVGSNDYRREYTAQAVRRNLNEKWITFLDSVSDTAPILRQLDALVMPSLWEACPLLAMEAMCVGIPVIGSDCIGLREVLANTPALTFPAGNAGALAAAISQAQASPSMKGDAVRFAPHARCRFEVTAPATVLAQLFSSFVRASTSPDEVNRGGVPSDCQE